MRKPSPLLLSLLLLSLGAGCPPSLDDDDATVDDDDSVDDDDATMDDDDATMDDDDSAGPTCDALLEAALVDFTTWSSTRSCGDAFLSLSNSDDIARVSVQVDTSALSLAPNQTWTLDVAGVTVPPNLLSGWVGAQRGAFLSNNDCVGIPPQDSPIVDRSFTGSAGFVVFSILTADGNGGFTADVSLQGLVVTASDDAGTACSLPDRTVTGLGFGYWPG
jgi:hypothetical protein